MALDEIVTPADGVVRKLGCIPPASFPTQHKVYADTPAKIYTLDEIRAELANRPGKVGWNRRQRFAGRKYIRNQGQYGSCNGWSTAGALSRIRELRGEPYVCLSGADAYSQMNGGQDNGSVLSDGLKVVETGIAPEDLVPFNRIYTNQISSEAKASRSRFRGVIPYACDSLEEFASGILTGECGIVAVHATNAFNSEDSNGLNRGGNGPGNHSVLIDDVKLADNGDIWFNMPNSWDIDFCQGGMTYLEWEQHLRETVKYHRFWLLLSATDDTQDSSIPPVIKK